MIAPYIIGLSFRATPGMPELVRMYSTSLIYGAPGISISPEYVEQVLAVIREQYHSITKAPHLEPPILNKNGRL
jgi:hypothetical protein